MPSSSGARIIGATSRSDDHVLDVNRGPISVGGNLESHRPRLLGGTPTQHTSRSILAEQERKDEDWGDPLPTWPGVLPLLGRQDHDPCGRFEAGKPGPVADEN